MGFPLVLVSLMFESPACRDHLVFSIHLKTYVSTQRRGASLEISEVIGFSHATQLPRNPEVAESLAASEQEIRALLCNGDLEGIQIGGRGQRRIEDVKLDEYIEWMYAAQGGATRPAQ